MDLSFFQSTTTAANALYGDFKFKAYYNVGFHLDAITSFFYHILRSLHNLLKLTFHLVSTPFRILIPIFWLTLPTHALNILDDVAGLGLSLLSVAIHPVIFTLRTVSSLIRGYEEGSAYDCGVDDEEKDLSLAMVI